jgi:hypothetical protein
MIWRALVVALAGAAGQGDIWPALWADLGALRAGGLSAAESSACEARIEKAIEDLPESPRASLARACIETLHGRDATLAASRLQMLRPSPFTAIELWHLADLLSPGPDRAHIVLEALADEQPLARWQVLLAWNVAVDEARALRFEQGALPLQFALHERFRQPSTASDLALTHRALGQGEAADRVLASSIGRAEEGGENSYELWEARGINALGFGDVQLARDYLGRAVAHGSLGAALLLSRLELMSKHDSAARAGFRALILDTPPPDWAWRGWGTAALPPAFAPAQRRSPGTLHE